jgi:hypothetical protein
VKRPSPVLAILAVTALAGASCGDDGAPAPAVSIEMELGAPSDFYAAGFPSDVRLDADGRVDLSGFPLPATPNVVTSVIAMLDHQARGFGLTSGVFFEATGPLDESALPDVHASVSTGSPVALLSIDPGSPDYLRRYPISVKFLADGGPYGAKNLLALLPLQGIPLRPKTRYAAIVTDALHSADGEALVPSRAMAALANGARLAAEGAREAAAIVAAETGAPRPLPSLAMRGPLVGAALAIARALSPLDLEAFLRYHFGKVGAQTRAMLDEYAERAEACSLPHDAIDELRAALASSAERFVGS